MCAMLHILYTNDYGLPNHPCDSGATVNGQFNESQDVINYIMNSIYQAYHAGEDIYSARNNLWRLYFHMYDVFLMAHCALMLLHRDLIFCIYFDIIVKKIALTGI